MSARLVLAVLAAASVFAAPGASGQKFQPGSVYICPNSSETGLDCYLDAVIHLYTMCRHVKSIEIIEFGHAKAQEGVNGAKSEYCVDKQKINITRPYQAALREATPFYDAVDNLRALQAFWLEALINLRWRDGEPGDDYEYRVTQVYNDLSWKVDAVRVSFSTAPAGAVAPQVASSKPKAAKAKAAAPAKAN